MKRRHFLQSTAALLALPIIGNAEIKKKMPLLSFSTLGCPDWSFDEIMIFAKANGYNGLEIRGIKREMMLPKVPEFQDSNIATTLAKMKKHGLRFVDLGSSCSLHFDDGTERDKNLDEGKQFIDLAAKLNCPFVRVFPNNIPAGKDPNAVMDQMIKGLQYLGDYAKGTSVTVLLETHGDGVQTKDVLHIMQSTDRKNVGLVWDVVNMWVVTKEAPAGLYQTLKPYIRHTHIKDAVINNGKIEYKFLGQGETPILQAIDLLMQSGYKGFYSFEWEKLWHPELPEPALALADYPKAFERHLAQR
jgi:sugar phosphate isomerase/epimerase